MIPVFRAIVARRKVVLFEEEKYQRYLSSLEGENVEVVVRKAHSQRSIEQNRLYFGVVVKMISDETGYSKDEVHEILKAMFLVRQVEISKSVYRYVQSTTRLNTKQFNDYIEQCRVWAKGELKLIIPLENEVEV